MNILPISDQNPACYGVQCHRHHECERYAMVEATSWHHTIGTCDDGQGGRPLFLAINRESEQLAAAAEVAAC